MSHKSSVPQRDARIRTKDQPQAANPSEFERQAAQSQPGLVREMWAMLLQNKKWWLAPILLMLLVLGAIVFLGGTAAAPFIYTLF